VEEVDALRQPWLGTIVALIAMMLSLPDLAPIDPTGQWAVRFGAVVTQSVTQRVRG
jgi:hypothetical protein